MWVRQNTAGPETAVWVLYDGFDGGLFPMLLYGTGPRASVAVVCTLSACRCRPTALVRMNSLKLTSAETDKRLLYVKKHNAAAAGRRMWVPGAGTDRQHSQGKVRLALGLVTLAPRGSSFALGFPTGRQTWLWR